jgi:branched-subunit amino acid ABC-type transport system permease component
MSTTQVLVNSLIAAAELGLLAVGLTLVYSILRFANFAHTEFATVGAYLTFLFNVTVGVNIVLAVLLSAVFTGLLAVGLDRTIFRRLRGAGAVTLMITSFGLAIALRNTVRAIWGPAPQNYDLPLQRPLILGEVRLTPLHLVIIVTALAFMLLLHLLLHKTKLGKAMRAASDNPDLAQASGIDTEKVVLWVWFLSAMLAAIGGSLIGMETYLKPIMGFATIIPVFSAAIVGGIGNPYGALLGAFLVGLAENFGLHFNFAHLVNLGGLLRIVEGAWYIPTGYKAAISFTLLIVTLLLRPQGLLGQRGVRVG